MISAFGVEDDRISKAKGMGKAAQGALGRLGRAYGPAKPVRAGQAVPNPNYDPALITPARAAVPASHGHPAQPAVGIGGTDPNALAFLAPKGKVKWASPYKNPKKEAKAAAAARQNPQGATGKDKPAKEKRFDWSGIARNRYAQGAVGATAVGGTGALGYMAYSDHKR